MTFQETLDFLYHQLPVFHRDGASAYKKDLSRTYQLLNFLDNPHLKFKSIHIAGTNGKGSTSHFIASILQETGYKTGLYTSPHIKYFGERIKINGKFIDEDFVIDFVKKVNHLLTEVQPSFFELTVAMAFHYFALNKVEIAIIETGLGGRLDSTNVIQPILSLITNISYDHADLLGPTIQDIAFQKAGIIKQNTPVIISERQKETENVFITEAALQNAKLIFASDHYSIEKTGITESGLEIEVHNGKTLNLISGLTGQYQLKNLSGVLQAVTELNNHGIQVTEENVKTGLQKVITNTGLKGRWQILSKSPLIICDIAHNEAGIREILSALQELKPSKIHFIIGMVRDKEIDKVLNLLPSSAKYYFSQAHIPRALPANDLKDQAIKFGIKGDVFTDVNHALKEARLTATDNDVIMICGSTFLVSEVAEV